MTGTGRDWALVTGASSGIGRALVRALARRGIGVALSGRSRQRLAAVARQCRKSTPALSCSADLAAPVDRKRLVASVADTVRPPDRLSFLVHCAGVGDPAANFAAMRPKALEEALAVNVTAALDLTQRLLPQLAEAPSSRLMFVGAGIADHPQPGTGVYGISKQALARLFEQMVVDFDRHDDARLPALALFQPGLVDTEGLRDHVTRAGHCRLPHAAWLRARLEDGDALSARQAADAMASALLDLERDVFHRRTLHARDLLQ